MKGFSRRRFLAYSAGIGGGLLIPAGATWARARTASAFATPTLPGANIPKFRDALTILPAMPRASRSTDSATGATLDQYRIASMRFRQQVLPSGMAATTVFGLIVGVALVVIAEFVLDGLADGNQTWHWIQHGVFFLGGLVVGVSGLHVYLSDPR